MNFAINPLIAIGVLPSTAATDAAYVFFNASVAAVEARTPMAISGLMAKFM